LVRLGGNVYFLPEQFEAMLGAIRGFLAEHEAITLAEARDLLGTSRKYIQAILEELDARRITRREGDARVLR
jgi:selenocysteine-specific elongation factor